MDKDVDLDITEPAESSILLGILPTFLSHKLINERSFREKIGFEAEESVSYGENITFARFKFFERVAEAFNIEHGHSEIEDEVGNKWLLTREETTENRIVLKISFESEIFFAAEFFVFLPEATERLRELDVVLREHGFAKTGLTEWRAILTERTFTFDEFDEFSQDIMKTPFSFLKEFRRKIKTTNISATDMVPGDLEFFENFCGAGNAANLPDFVKEVVSRVVSDYLTWNNLEGPRMALLMCSHPLISTEIAASGIKDQQLIELAEWARDHGDVFAKVGTVEVAISVARRGPELESVLVDIVRQIIALNPDDESGPLQALMSLIVLVESEVSRTRVLSDWPIFRRRLATFAHAALLARLVENKIDSARLSTWIMKNHGLRFYIQNLMDLHAEPRWLPDYVSPMQLKQELLGRLYNAFGRVPDGLAEGPLRDILDPQNRESSFNKARTIKSSYPGPLEGSDLSLRNAIPQELEDGLDRSLSGGKLTAESITVLINATGHFRVGRDKAERAVEIIRASNFRFAEEMSDAERFSFVHGLAEVASRLRSESLAKSVRAVSRSHRDDSKDGRRFGEEVIVCLIAAGAFKEFDAWKDFVGEWVNELCFNVKRECANELCVSLEMMCSIEPRLRSRLGAGLAALASIQ